MFRRFKKIDLDSIDKYTNGELLAYCNRNKIPISPNPTREQLITAIQATPVNQYSTQIPPSSIPYESKDKSPSIQTPKPFFFPAEIQPTPICANQNYEYDRMWDRKLRKQNRSYKDAFPSNPGQMSPSIKELSHLEGQKRNSNNYEYNWSLYVEVSVFILIILFFVWFFMKF